MKWIRDKTYDVIVDYVRKLRGSSEVLNITMCEDRPAHLEDGRLVRAENTTTTIVITHRPFEGR